jgi:hypothetical protein
MDDMGVDPMLRKPSSQPKSVTSGFKSDCDTPQAQLGATGRSRFRPTVASLIRRDARAAFANPTARTPSATPNDRPDIALAAVVPGPLASTVTC